MINMILLDPNETHGRSLKTMLEQIADFRVTLLEPTTAFPDDPRFAEASIMLIDIRLFREMALQVSLEAIRCRERPKILILAMYADELTIGFGHAAVILKNSGKAAFEAAIRGLGADQPGQNEEHDNL